MAEKIRQHSESRMIVKEPFTIAVHFLLAGIVILFLGLTYGYLFQMGENWLDFSLPKVFWLSTLAILNVSFCLHQSLKAFDSDDRLSLRRYLIFAAISASLFIYCQLSGWQELKQLDIVLQTSPSSSYLYLLTGLHGIHVIVGIVFLVVAITRAFFNTGDDVKSLIYFSDHTRRTRIRLLRNYWHTVDILWVFLFLVFLYKHA